MDWDSLRLNLWYTLTGEIEKVLTDESSIADGRLYFYPGYNRIAFPIYFSALEKGGTNLKLTVESDSEFSTTSVQFYLPIKYKVVKDSTILPNP